MLKLLVSLVPAVLGVLIVVQAGLNRKIATQTGIVGATCLNAVVLVSIALLLFATLKICFPESDLARAEFRPFSLWFFLPGAIGCLLVIGTPYAIAKWGAIYTFVMLMSAQLAASIVWDIKVEGLSVSLMRAVGVAVTWLGVFLVFRGR